MAASVVSSGTPVPPSQLPASPLPPELLALARSQLARLPEFAAELAALLSEKEEFYRRVHEAAPDELRKVCEVNLRHAFHAFIEGSEVALDAVRKTGRVQARQGVPISAVLRAFRIAGTFTYERLMERAIPPGVIPPEQLLPVSTGVWKIIDFYSDAIAGSYREVEADAARGADRARAAALDGLLAGRFAEQAEFDEAARVLGLPLAGPFVVLHADRSPDPALAASALVAGRSWRSAWWTVADAETGVVAVDGDGSARLRRALAGVPYGVGMSSPVGGLDLVPAALRRARVARRCLPPGAGGLAGFGDRPVATLAAGAPELARDLAAEVLSGVLALPAAEREVLLGTLGAWFAGGGSARVAAEGLFVHPNTVRYRIRRVQELTGRDLADPRAVAELYLALETARLDPPPGAVAPQAPPAND